MNAVEKAQVWIISDNEALSRGIRQLLAGLSVATSILDPAAVDKDDFWERKPGQLKLVILDVNGRLDWGWEFIRRIRLARIQAPMVVLTEMFSRDFGAKIISQGVRYYFSHDYCKEEFLEVAQNLINPRSPRRQDPLPDEQCKKKG